MTQFETVRLYKGYINRWYANMTDSRGRDIQVTTQWERPYTEYRADGSVKQTGTEDFSRERERQLANYRVFIWNGTDLNRGGHRKFREIGWCIINRADKHKAADLVRIQNPGTQIVELRAF